MKQVALLALLFLAPSPIWANGTEPSCAQGAESGALPAIAHRSLAPLDGKTLAFLLALEMESRPSIGRKTAGWHNTIVGIQNETEKADLLSTIIGARILHMQQMTTDIEIQRALLPLSTIDVYQSHAQKILTEVVGKHLKGIDAKTHRAQYGYWKGLKASPTAETQQGFVKIPLTLQDHELTIVPHSRTQQAFSERQLLGDDAALGRFLKQPSQRAAAYQITAVLPELSLMDIKRLLSALKVEAPAFERLRFELRIQAESLIALRLLHRQDLLRAREQLANQRFSNAELEASVREQVVQSELLLNASKAAIPDTRVDQSNALLERFNSLSARRTDLLEEISQAKQRQNLRLDLDREEGAILARTEPVEFSLTAEQLKILSERDTNKVPAEAASLPKEEKPAAISSKALTDLTKKILKAKIETELRSDDQSGIENLSTYPGTQIYLQQQDMDWVVETFYQAAAERLKAIDSAHVDNQWDNDLGPLSSGLLAAAFAIFNHPLGVDPVVIRDGLDRMEKIQTRRLETRQANIYDIYLRTFNSHLISGMQRRLAHTNRNANVWIRPTSGHSDAIFIAAIANEQSLRIYRNAILAEFAALMDDSQKPRDWTIELSRAFDSYRDIDGSATPKVPGDIVARTVRVLFIRISPYDGQPVPASLQASLDSNLFARFKQGVDALIGEVLFEQVGSVSPTILATLHGELSALVEWASKLESQNEHDVNQLRETLTSEKWAELEAPSDIKSAVGSADAGARALSKTVNHDADALAQVEKRWADLDGERLRTAMQLALDTEGEAAISRFEDVCRELTMVLGPDEFWFISQRIFFARLAGHAATPNKARVEKWTDLLDSWQEAMLMAVHWSAAARADLFIKATYEVVPQEIFGEGLQTEPLSFVVSRLKRYLDLSKWKTVGQLELHPGHRQEVAKQFMALANKLSAEVPRYTKDINRRTVAEMAATLNQVALSSDLGGLVVPSISEISTRLAQLDDELRDVEEDIAFTQRDLDEVAGIRPSVPE